MTVLYAFNLLGYLIWALIVWGLLWVYGVKSSFGRSYSVVLYASVLFMIFDILSFVITFTKSNWFQFIVIAAFLYYMFKKTDSVPAAEVTPVVHPAADTATEVHADAAAKTDALPAERITDEDTNNGVK
jgi:hypothetical protein